MARDNLQRDTRVLGGVPIFIATHRDLWGFLRKRTLHWDINTPAGVPKERTKGTCGGLSRTGTLYLDTQVLVEGSIQPWGAQVPVWVSQRKGHKVTYRELATPHMRTCSDLPRKRPLFIKTQKGICR